MKAKMKTTLFLILALSLLWATGLKAQLTVLNSNLPPGFDMLGYIQAATENPGVDPNRGGTLTMNGVTMIVPANSVIQFPANTLKWADLFDPLVYDPVYDASLPLPLQANMSILAGASGLAMLDNPAQTLGVSPWVPFNAIVQGNVDVKNERGFGVGAYIVGLILPISQDLGNTGAAFITYIDYPKGRFEVGGTLNTPNTGTIIEINDPLGRYGWAHSPDPRFSVDSENPTISAGNGYPMCLPKVAPPAVDVDCPITNRPLNPPIGVFNHDPFLQAGAPLQSFFMPASPIGPGRTIPDPWKKVPFMVGDYIGFSGTLLKLNPAAALNPALPMKQQVYISANTVSSDKLAVYTAPGTVGTAGPCYLTTARMVIGNGGASLTLPASGTGAARIEGGIIPLPESRLNIVIHGWCTDSTQLVDIFAIGINPATGAEVPRLLGTILPEPGVAAGNKAGNKGRFRFDVGKGNFLPATRFYKVQSRHGTLQLPNQVGLNNAALPGLLSGQYHAPMFTFQFPDAAPGFPVMPNNFNTIPFLTSGEGGNPSAGPLNPFPPSFP